MRFVIRAWYVEVGLAMMFATFAFATSDSKAYSDTFQFDNHTIIVSDLQVALSCFSFEMPCAAANTNTGQIFVNNKFFGMRNSWKAAVLHHEIGHIELGHTSSLWDAIGRIFSSESALGREIEADMYSARKGYGLVLLRYFQALQQVIAMAENAEIPELQARIKALEEYHAQNLHLRP